jgi:hypothetical protein
MIYSLTTLKPLAGLADGFIEFTTIGTNQTITSSMIPFGVTRVRVHLIGAGGGYSGAFNGGASTFSAAGVSVMASGGNVGAFFPTFTGGAGGGISAVAGIISAASGGTGGLDPFGDPGDQGGLGTAIGVAMGGGGGGCGFDDNCNSPYGGPGGAVGRLAGRLDVYGFLASSGAGGGFGSTNPVLCLPT